MTSGVVEDVLDRSAQLTTISQHVGSGGCGDTHLGVAVGYEAIGLTENDVVKIEWFGRRQASWHSKVSSIPEQSYN